MKKALFTATVDSHILQFHIPYLKMFKENGYEVHVATNGNKEIPYCDVKHVIPFERSPIKINNLRAIKQLKQIIKGEEFDIIHCHTPMGATVTRLAAKKARKKGTRVIYTAHGFHFFKGAPIKNWLMFYPVEKWLSRYTDCLITINNEDYKLARKKFKKCKQIELVYGVGIDENKFNFEMTVKEKKELKKSLNLEDSDFVLIEVGELNKNKNQIMAIEAMREIVKENSNVHLLLVGEGKLEDFYKNKIKEYNLENNVHMLGYRNDIPKLMKISDILLSLSYREGLPVNVIEGIMSKLPIIATNCRGNRDLVENGKNGVVIKTCDVCELTKAVKEIIEKPINNYYNHNVQQYELKTSMFIYSKIIGLKYENELIKKSEDDVISIIVPVYNTEKYLEKNINSLINQTYKNIEIIFINDGSTDKSLEILEKYAQKDKRIKIINQEKQGVSNARNKGIDSATGKYIMFVDSDDWIDMDACENLIDIQKLYNAEFIYSNYIKEYEKKSIINKIDENNNLINIYRKRRM